VGVGGVAGFTKWGHRRDGAGSRQEEEVPSFHLAMAVG
jgi:hypothetical protein